MATLNYRHQIEIRGQDGLRWSLNLFVIPMYTRLAPYTDVLQAFFNVMLKEMGVKGVKTREIWSMDEDELATLP